MSTPLTFLHKGLIQVQNQILVSATETMMSLQKEMVIRLSKKITRLLAAFHVIFKGCEVASRWSYMIKGLKEVCDIQC